MKLVFEVKSPNFAITDKGKFSLAQLDDDDFKQYLHAIQMAIIDRREEQKKQLQEKETTKSHGYISGS